MGTRAEQAELCTVDTCSIEAAALQYIPSLGANVFFLSIFAICLIAQLGLGIFYRTWGFMIGMLFGCGLELAGYLGRILYRDDPFQNENDWFLLQIVCITIGPAFFTAAVYLCLGRIIQVYGNNLSRLKPRTYTITFITFDFLSLVLQAIGGAIASSSEDNDGVDLGVDIMIGGLVFHVVAIGLFMIFWAELSFRHHRASEHDKDPEFAALRSSRRFKAFRIALWIATLLIFGRCIYRVAELQGGFDSEIANHEESFIVLESLFIAVAASLLTILHPGPIFRSAWRNANWTFRTKPKAPQAPRITKEFS